MGGKILIFFFPWLWKTNTRAGPSRSPAGWRGVLGAESPRAPPLWDRDFGAEPSPAPRLRVSFGEGAGCAHPPVKRGIFPLSAVGLAETEAILRDSGNLARDALTPDPSPYRRVSPRTANPPGKQRKKQLGKAGGLEGLGGPQDSGGGCSQPLLQKKGNKKINKSRKSRRVWA